MATFHLTNEQFIARVADYKANPGDFKFLGDKPALIDFYAEWCGPCKMLAPVLEELSNEFEGKLDVYKVNVDEEEELSMLFDIRSIPTLIFIEKNGTMHRSQGAMGKSQLKETVEKLLF
ncbi:MAG: thioredoxin [Bacteroidaceae bacterium]|nr:thioredoxin [Bacteroidaceae bacterium]